MGFIFFHLTFGITKCFIDLGLILAQIYFALVPFYFKSLIYQLSFWPFFIIQFSFFAFPI